MKKIDSNALIETEELVSIIIPVYNAEKYLEESFNSVKNQSYSNCEIVMVDDGSTDASAQICDRFQKDYNNVVFIRNNHCGPAKARMIGIEHSHGAYITFCDADDSMKSSLVEQLMKYKEFDLVSTGIDVIVDGEHSRYDEANIPYGTYKGESLCYFIQDMIFVSDTNKRGLNISMSGKLFKRSIIDEIKNNLDLRIRYGEDRDFLYQYVLKCSSVYMNDYIGYNYIRRNDSSSKRYDPEFFIDANRLRNSLMRAFAEHPLKNVLTEKFERQMRDVYLYGIKNKLGYEDLFHTVFIAPYMKKEYKKIAIYGSGSVGKSYVNYISDYHDCNIVIWVDSKNFDQKIMGIMVEKPEALLESEFDVVFIAVKNKLDREQIFCNLTKMGIDEEKICDDEPLTIDLF